VVNQSLILYIDICSENPHQGKPWVSIGFGLAIFSKETAVAVKKNPTN
jgi:hypothetical protein